MSKRGLCNIQNNVGNAVVNTKMGDHPKFSWDAFTFNLSRCNNLDLDFSTVIEMSWNFPCRTARLDSAWTWMSSFSTDEGKHKAVLASKFKVPPTREQRRGCPCRLNRKLLLLLEGMVVRKGVNAQEDCIIIMNERTIVKRSKLLLLLRHGSFILINFC